MLLDAAGTLAICLAVGVLSVLGSDIGARWLPIPAVVLEIAGGIIVGPDVLGLTHDNEIVEAFSQLGLVVLMLLAGYEIDVAKVAGRPLRAAGEGWSASLVIGLSAGVAWATLVSPEENASSGLLIGLLFTTTALGTVLPILRDTGELESRFGTFVLAGGAVGEFGPILAIAVLLGDDSLAHTLAVLAVFAVVATVVMLLAARPHSLRMSRLLSHTLETSGQLGVRVAMLLVVILAWIAGHLGLDVLLGAFTAGLVLRVFFSGMDERTQGETMARLEGAGYGFLIPIFFVVSGIRFDLDALLSEPTALVLVPVALLLFLVVRGGPTYVGLRGGALVGRDRVAAAVYTATALPLIVVITGIGLDEGELKPATAAALVAAGMLSVLLLPLSAIRIRGTPTPEAGWSDASDVL